jgi:DNA-binding transcriptional MerR regulator
MNAEEQKPACTVKKISEMAGVSVRTLHLYDQIDLLKPSVRTEAGYRLYGEPELLRLQQILFYKELGFSLQQIAEILDDPGFNLIDALEQHKRALQARQASLETLMQTLDNTITKIKNGMKLSHEELYEGLPKETADAWRQEAIDNYGLNAVTTSEKSLGKMGKQDFERLKKESLEISTNLAAMMNEDPASPQVQKLVAKHYRIIRKFWGTDGAADKQAENYAGLGDLYVADARFTMHNGKAQPEFALFMQKAMKEFAKTVLGK